MRCPVELQKIIDTLPLSVHVIDSQGRMVEANRAWLIYFGITMDQVRGKLLSDVMRNMIFFNSGGLRKDTNWEFTAPAALETLRTKLPHTATLHQGQSVAVARPLLDDRGEIQYVVTTVVELVRSERAKRFSQIEPAESQLLGESAPIQHLRRLIAQVALAEVRCWRDM